MLKNYFKVTFRNLVRNRNHTLINVGGLTLGITCAIIIFLVLRFEYSFDTWHADSERVYRVVRQAMMSGQMEFTPGVPTAVTQAVENEVSGLEVAAVIDRNMAPVVLSIETDQRGKIKVQEENAAFIQPSYFDIFSPEWIAGDPGTALERPNTAVVTRSMAERLFGNDEPVGQIVNMLATREYSLEVTGIIEDPPLNTDFSPAFLVSYSSLNLERDRFGAGVWWSWGADVEGFVKLQPGVSKESVNQQLESLQEKYMPAEQAEGLDFVLQPLSDIHFDARYGIINGSVVEKRYLMAVGLIGLLLLLAACINFINLNTAVAARRAREVGLRKAFGGSRRQLTLYFLGETAIITLFSILVSLGAAELLSRQLNPILGYVPEFNMVSSGSLILFLTVLFVTVTLLAGWYSAQHLSQFKPVEAMKKRKGQTYGSGLNLRRALIVTQFSITLVLIICVLIISDQMKLVQTRDMGFDAEAVVEVQTPLNDQSELELFKSELDGRPGILDISFSNNGTVSGSSGADYVFEDGGMRHEGIGRIKIVEEAFVDTYGLTILAGRNIRSSNESEEYIVNEMVATELGYAGRYDELIGKTMTLWRVEAPIVGVVKDFNTESLHEPVGPVILTSSSDFERAGVRIDLNRTSEALASIDRAFGITFPDYVFEYEFLDEIVASFYEREQRTARLMSGFTFIAILIGSLGLFGLVSYMTSTRTREIGVRKVLGASVASIVGLFGKEFARLTGLAFVISTPTAWLVMNLWLDNFAYQIEIGAGVFFLAGGIAMLIVLLTIGWQSVRAALANPVEAIGSE